MAVSIDPKLTNTDDLEHTMAASYMVLFVFINLIAFYVLLGVDAAGKPLTLLGLLLFWAVVIVSSFRVLESRQARHTVSSEHQVESDQMLSPSPDLLAWWQERTPSGRLMVAVIAVLASIVAMGLVPAVLVPEPTNAQAMTQAEVLRARNEWRDTIVKGFGAFFIVITAVYTSRQIRIAHEQKNIAQEGEATNRFIKAIEHLNSEHTSARLGAVFALERIAKESEREHWNIVRILTAFLREYSSHAYDHPAYVRLHEHRRLHETMSANELIKRVIINFLVERDVSQDEEGRAIVLPDVDLSFQNVSMLKAPKSRLDRALLLESRLSGVDLRQATLNQANLSGAMGDGADLSEVTAVGASFVGVRFRDVNLHGANLRNANFRDAVLIGCNFDGADLTGAVFSGANVTGATFAQALLVNTVFRDRTRQEIEREEQAVLEAMVEAHHFGADLDQYEPDEEEFLSPVEGLTIEQLRQARRIQSCRVPLELELMLHVGQE